MLDLDDSAIHATVDDEDEAEAEDLPELQSEFPDSDDDSPADGRDGPGAS